MDRNFKIFFYKIDYQSDINVFFIFLLKKRTTTKLFLQV